MQMVLLILLAAFQVIMTGYLVENPDFYQLDAYTWESDGFRAMKLGEYAALKGDLDMGVLTSMMIEEEYDLTGLGEETVFEENPAIERRRPAEYRKLRHAYETVLGDLRYFPIPKSSRPETPDVTYEDTWMDKRSYGGDGGMRAAISWVWSGEGDFTL